MMQKIQNIFLVTLLATLLISVGCAKKQVSNSATNNPTASLVDNETESNNPIELNGSSDENKAGAIQTIYFEMDSSNISSETKNQLEANANFLKSNESIKVLIEGHCDERGGVQYNLALGEKRAKTVRDYLSALGVKKSRLDFVSHGKERPQDEGHDESAWSKNRRASFVIQAK